MRFNRIIFKEPFRFRAAYSRTFHLLLSFFSGPSTGLSLGGVIPSCDLEFTSRDLHSSTTTSSSRAASPYLSVTPPFSDPQPKEVNMTNMYNEISDKELILLTKLVRSRVNWYLREQMQGPYVVMAQDLEIKLMNELDRRFPEGWEQNWGGRVGGK